MEPVRVPRYGAAGAFIKLAAGAGVRYGAGQKYFKNSTRTPHHYGAGNDGPRRGPAIRERTEAVQ